MIGHRPVPLATSARRHHMIDDCCGQPARNSANLQSATASESESEGGGEDQLMQAPLRLSHLCRVTGGVAGIGGNWPISEWYLLYWLQDARRRRRISVLLIFASKLPTSVASPDCSTSTAKMASAGHCFLARSSFTMAPPACVSCESTSALMLESVVVGPHVSKISTNANTRFGLCCTTTICPLGAGAELR